MHTTLNYACANILNYTYVCSKRKTARFQILVIVAVLVEVVAMVVVVDTTKKSIKFNAFEGKW